MNGEEYKTVVGVLLRISNCPMKKQRQVQNLRLRNEKTLRDIEINMLNKTIFAAAVEYVRISRQNSKLVHATMVPPESFRLHFTIFQDLTKSYLQNGIDTR